MNKLNPFDIALEGRYLVEASAGTGKTYNITSLFIRCLVEKELSVHEILVLTYTKAATAELKERILNRLRESIEVLERGEIEGKDDFLEQLLAAVEEPPRAVKKLEEAVRNFDESSIFTIHAFCQRALLEQSFLSGIPFDSELIADDSDIVQEAVDDYWRGMQREAEASETGRVWLNILDDEGYTPDLLRDIVSMAMGKPYLHWDAGRPQGESLQGELETLLTLFSRLQSAWKGEQRDIQELLLSEAMNGNRYRSTSVPGWIEEVDYWLENELPSLDPPVKFDRFTTAFIRENGVRKGKEPPEHPFFDAADAFWNQIQRVRTWLPAFKKEVLEYSHGEVRDKKLSGGELGYDDFLVLLDEALRNSPSLGPLLREKYPVALVDEFQDTDPVQYNILDAIYSEDAEGCGLFLIGDPKQSIYSFRGADVFSYLEARKKIPGSQEFSLERNFRSESRLIDGINAVWGSVEDPFLIPEIRYSPVRPGHKPVPPMLQNGDPVTPITILHSMHLEEEASLNKQEGRRRAARVTAESIALLLQEGTSGSVAIGDEPIRPEDIAVLVRTHKQAEMVRLELVERGLKSVQYSRESIFSTPEALQMEWLLHALAEPRNEEAIRTVLATELFPYTAEDLVRLGEEDRSWVDMLDDFADWHRNWNEYGFAYMFRKFLKESDVEQQLVSLEQGERKLTNLLQIAELLQEREQREHAGMFELIRWIARKREEPDRDAEEEQLRLESDEKLVKLVTMHRSKGLEYPVVYCPYLWDGAYFQDKGEPVKYHDPDQGNRAVLDLNEKDHERRNHKRYLAAREELSESLRLAYVAMTRARQKCFIVYEPAGDIEYSPLGYLALGPERAGEQLRQKIIEEGSTPSVPVPEFSRGVGRLVENHPSVIERRPVDDLAVSRPAIREDELSGMESNRELSAREAFVSPYVISSFSSIMHPSGGYGEEDIRSDELFLPVEFSPVEPESDPDRTVFTFPKGPGPGTFLHQVFEELEFGNKDARPGVIRENMERFGIDGKWEPVVNRMVSTALDVELPGGITLADLTGPQQVKEMEFHFELSGTERRRLLDIIRRDSGGASRQGISVPNGLMKGYIDLVFRANSQFYILDYKSNYLGDEPGDYERPRLEEEMLKTGYDVQYHIYTLALHRYLAQRVPGYSYKDHFGGVYYLFVRGMGHNETPAGVYLDKPGEEKITELDRLFREGGAS